MKKLLLGFAFLSFQAAALSVQTFTGTWQGSFKIPLMNGEMRTVIRISMAEVDKLMAVFYSKLWRDNLPPLEALREAQLGIYRHPEQIKDLAERGFDLKNTVKLPATTASPSQEQSSKAR